MNDDFVIIRDAAGNVRQRLRRADRNLQIAGLGLLTSAMVAFAVWLLWSGACLWSREVLLCRHPHGAWIVVISAAGLVWLSTGLALHDKLQRKVRRGMYARPGALQWRAPVGAFKRSVEAVFAAEAETEPATYSGTWSVWTPIDNGTTVIVDRHEFYEWVLDVLHRDQRKMPGESPIGQRYWERRIGRYQWHARCTLLEESGAIVYGTSSRTSRRFKALPASEIMANLDKLRLVE